MNQSPVSVLIWPFLSISLFAIGGANAVVPEMHRQIVDIAGLMTSAEFAHMYAIGQATPGPNILIVTLIGWHVAGIPGALTATLAMCGPTLILTYVVGGLWEKFRAARWRRLLQVALMPLTIGLIAASGYILALGTGRSIGAMVLIAASAAAVFHWKMNPLWPLAAGAVLGLAGLV